VGIIYLSRNLVNGKGYIGKTKGSLENRKQGHRRSARSSSVPFHCAIRKYGFDAFGWKIVAECTDSDDFNETEQVMIKLCKTKVPRGYNLTDGGDGGPIRLGMKNSEEARAKVSKAHRGRIMSQETRKKMSLAKKGWKPSKALLEAARKANLGKHLSNEIKEKLSLAKKGKKLSEEHRAKLRKPKPKGFGEVVSKRLIGRKLSMEHRAKISASGKGKRHRKPTAEGRMNMSLAHRKPWSEKKRKAYEAHGKTWSVKRREAYEVKAR